MLALPAGALGLGLSVYGIRYLGTAFAGREIGAPASSAVMPYWVDLSMNQLVYAFVGGMCVLTTLLAGLAPALHVARANTNASLKEGGRGGASLRTRQWTGGFMIVQIALTVVLLTSAGLMLRTFVTLYRADRVIDTARMATARISLSGKKYAASEARHRFVEQLDQRLSASPMFVGATLTTTQPFNWTGATRRLNLGSASVVRVEDLPTVGLVQADARYFDVLGLKMIRGRSLVAADAENGREGAVIDQRLAQMYFPDIDPVGQQIRLAERADRGDEGDLWTIVGVTPTIPHNLGSPDDALPVVFALLTDRATPAGLSIVVRSRSDVAAAIAQLREEVRALDPNLPVYYAQTLEEAFAEARYALNLIGGWFGALAAIAVLLAAVGLFAMTGHAVTQRTQEVGVRIALGARNSEIVWLFLRQTLLQLALGTTVGVAGALAAGQLLRNFIARTNPTDPLTLVSVTLLLVTVAIGATLLPARRAARIDPIVALRYE
jgi:putative ABC transport system permease protein